MAYGKVLLGAAVVGAGIIAFNVTDDPYYTVEKVVDGDTIQVTSPEGENGLRVRFLNVDTPEMGAAGTPAGCMAQEATDYLTGILPTGSKVRLETDVEEYDRYDRLLAGVYLEGSDDLINADIAREGLGLAVVFEPNVKFYDEVKAAEEQATSAQQGLFEPVLGCDIVQLQSDISEDLSELSEVSEWELEMASTSAFEAHGEKIGDVRRAIERARPSKSPADNDDGKAVQDYVVGRSEEIRKRNDKDLQAVQKTWDDERVRREEEAVRAAAQAEAERLELESREREREMIEERNRAGVQESNQQATGAGTPAVAPSHAPAPAPAAQPTGGGGDSYTGCRDYGTKLAPNAVDAAGRPFTKIDCSTKLPI